MNRKFNPVILVGAVLLLAGVVVLAVLASRGKSSDNATVKVLVATDVINIGTPAVTAKVDIEDVKKSDLPVGAVTSIAQISGQVALVKVAGGTVITTSTFGLEGATTATGVSLPKGLEATGVELTFAPGALRYIIPGNHINIWVATKKAADANGVVPFGSATQLLGDVLVLRTTPGIGSGEGQVATPGPGTLDTLVALNHSDTAKLIGALDQQPTLIFYFSLSNTSTS